MADDEVDEGGRFLVRNAVRADSCPPDLLRYIVETNLEGVADADSRGNLPLHYAAGYDRVAAGAAGAAEGTPGPPESHSKYVIDGAAKHRLKWRKACWTRKQRKIANSDLWVQLDQLIESRLPGGRLDFARW